MLEYHGGREAGDAEEGRSVHVVSVKLFLTVARVVMGPELIGLLSAFRG